MPRGDPKVMFSLRLPPALVEAIEESARKAGLGPREWAERELYAAASRDRPAGEVIEWERHP